MWRSKSRRRGSFLLSPIGFLVVSAGNHWKHWIFQGRRRKRHAETTEPSGKSGIRRLWRHASSAPANGKTGESARWKRAATAFWTTSESKKVCRYKFVGCSVSMPTRKLFPQERRFNGNEDNPARQRRTPNRPGLQ